MAIILCKNSVKGFIVTKMDQEIKFEEVCNVLESKKSFQRQ